MPASIKLQREYGDDLAVVFVESQGTSVPDTERFVMKMRWFGTRAMWTPERPFDSGSNGLPNYVLLGADGRVLQKGSMMSSQDHDLIAEEIRRAKGAPDGTDKALVGAWKDFAKGKYDAAIQAAREVAEKKPELAEAANAAVATFEQRVGSQLRRVEWMMDHGYPAEAQDRLDALTKGLAHHEELLARARELEARFDTPEMKRELEADKKLSRSLEKLFEDGRDEKLFEKLSKSAEEFAGTHVAERVQAYVAMKP